MSSWLTRQAAGSKRELLLFLVFILLLGSGLVVPRTAFGAAVDTSSATKFNVNTDTSANRMWGIAGLSEGKTGVLIKKNSTSYYEIYSSTGSLIKAVNITALIPRGSNIYALKVMALANGRSLITWEGNTSGCDNNMNSMYQFLMLNEDGTVYKPATDISTQTANYNCYTDTAELSDGKIAFLWQNDGSTYFTRIFNADGTSFSTQSPIETTGDREGNPAQNSTYTHSIAANNNGTYLIVYKFYNNMNFYGVLYNNDGSQKTVNGYQHFIVANGDNREYNDSSYVHTEALSNGNFLVAYKKNGAKMAKIITPDGTAIGSAINNASVKLGDDAADFLSLRNGGFLVTDSSTVGDYLDVAPWYDLHSYDQQVREFDNNGNMVTDWKVPDSDPSADNATYPYTGLMGYKLYKGYDQGFIAYNALTGNVTLHNVITSLKVTYDGSGQTSGTVPADNSSYKNGDTVTVADNTGGLTKTGYTFGGWSTLPNGGGTIYAAGDTFPISSSDVLLYAVWTPNLYTVSFDKNGGDVDAAPASKTAPYSGSVGTLPTAPTKAGYTFTGWNTDQLGTGTSFSAVTPVTGDVTLYAQWAINTYAVTFKDWDGSVLKTETVNHGSNATAPANPRRTGYSFTGWDKAFTNVTGALTVTAQYDVNSYTVSFDSQGGSAVADLDADYGTKITAPAAPTKVGYDFAGWYKDSGLTTEWNFSTDTIPAGDFTLYAKWAIKTYAVTFKDWDGSVLKTGTVNHGSNAVAPANPTRTGYSFTGWDKAFTNVTGALTVTAQYNVNSYTVSFDSKGGSSIDDMTANYGSILTAPDVPTLDGYNFVGWYKDAGLTTEWNFSTDTIPAGDFTLYAKWAIKTYAVTFKDWDGGVLKTETVNHGSAATAPADPSRTGYTFTGWNAAFTNVTGALTVTGQYDVNSYTVSFDSKGGSAAADQAADYGTKITAPADPTLVGYDFGGWYKDAGLTTEWNFSSDTIPAGDFTLYAKWNIKTYAVTFKDWDGGVLKTETVNHGSAAAAPADPTRNGYTFTGWDAAFTNVTGALTVTAQYDVNSYTVSFDSNGGSAVADLTANYDTAIPAPTAPTKAGYRFDGWYKEAALTTAWDFDTDTVPANGFMLYAKWTAVFTVTYDGNGSTTGSIPADSQLYEDQDSATVLGNTGALWKSGYSFDGWNTAADGTGTSYKAGDTLDIDNANVVLYATWKLVPYVPSVPTDPKPSSPIFKSVIDQEKLMDYLKGKLEQALKNPVSEHFSDVNQHWSKANIDLFVKMGFITGYQDNTFRPNASITRAEFAAVMVRVFDFDTSSSNKTFSDVKDNYWASQDIKALAASGIITGYTDGTFRPNEVITRAEIIAMISRIVDFKAAGAQQTVNFNDIASSWNADDIRSAASAGIINGRADGVFAPQEQSTRAEALSILLRVLSLNPELKALLDQLKV